MTAYLHGGGPTGSGPVVGSWTLEQDDEGHRTYKVSWNVRTDELEDGPATVIQCPGLPQPGDHWEMGNDIDVYAYCRPGMSVKMKQDKAGLYWQVDQVFSTKPLERCGNTRVEDPLLEKPKITVRFHKDKTDGTIDRFGKPIINSAWEAIQGAQNQWDDSYPVIMIEQNVADFDLDDISQIVDHTNDEELWGLDPGTIKLAEPEFEKKYTAQCDVYWTRKLSFEIRNKAGTVLDAGQVKEEFLGWARKFLDEGTKVLNGRWKGEEWVDLFIDFQYDDQGEPIFDPTSPTGFAMIDPDPDNPNHFIRFKDRNGENCRVILDGRGRPYIPEQAQRVKWWSFYNSETHWKTVLGTYDEAKEQADEVVNAFTGEKSELFGPWDTEQMAFDAIGQDDVGEPLVRNPASTPGDIFVDFYPRANFLELDIPTDLSAP